MFYYFIIYYTFLLKKCLSASHSLNFSPGLYCIVLYRPEIPPDGVTMETPLQSCACCRCITVTSFTVILLSSEMNIDDVLNECKTNKSESLNISHRGLVVLPDRISELITLKKLFLNNNHLILPPEEVRKQVEWYIYIYMVVYIRY